ncbi:MAG: UDP-N-acetylglucosamine 4,6-dehydratase (inverting) [Dehalococcoidia bacterium]|nr:UDP-N-acetylglucosamine 4,6-dehydratase (inverting) [Dehalococcoidia bacterium]
MSLNGKRILLTGGTGSFGKKFVDIAVREHSPEVIRIYSRDELKQEQMRREFPNSNLRFLIGDVRDKERLERAMNGIDIVVHAAALKQVPACEYNPYEAVKTNILGAQNVIEAALNCGVQKVMALSTDKAVNPINLYGATKLCAEKLFVQGNAYAGGGNPTMSCVRYGNVIGSRGSVIELFRQQAGSGEVTITDGSMTRFWITLADAARFVIRCLDVMRGGEIFVPKLTSSRISDLAAVVAPHARQRVIGIRPGEKIHEVLMTDAEVVRAREFEGYYLVPPEYPLGIDKQVPPQGLPMPEGFSYSSNAVTTYTREQIGILIADLD